ncbi:hypothetical protein TPL01_15260 [Sulfuriferula plumbiphila]|uniref:DUF4936 domain-containing protein n=1 Tax=Sulfuriferula plumbiphila TaxID=171865 RepID=A0A512L7D0_9PROT|nr:DUF4936 family protein [Sulfuriferula plumbiphila]BBP05351.1 hypothetical protein SFPGR_27730 [Sulfuriferula plumbiphila]GEP30388.1 hypothetical protein TPL01_15260 [Sulfuriferula plumbiphila]
MSTHYYIYYRVADDDTETETRIRAMQARLACRSGVSGHLLKRRDDPHTWMEIYENVADSIDFEQQLARAVSEFDVDMFLADAGRRVIECFVGDVAPHPTSSCKAN